MRHALLTATAVLGGALAGSAPSLMTAPPPMDYSASSLQLDAAADARGGGLPPGIGSRAVLEAMVAESVAWCAINGLLMRAPEGEGGPLEGPLFAHAPFSLLPAEYPAAELAKALALAPLFGTAIP